MDVAVVVCGASDPSPAMPPDWRLLATVTEPVNRISAERLHAFAAVDFERLLFIDARNLAGSELPSSADIVIDPFGAQARPLSPNRQVPRWLSVLAASAEEHFDVLLSRAVLARVGPFGNGVESVWGWVCRAVLAGESAYWPDYTCADEFPQKLPPLAPSGPDRECRVIAPLLKSGLEKRCTFTSRPDAVALQAGILQLHDDLAGSHELSQSVEGQGRRHAGDYWHAIMHCREGDFGNAKYWRRHVGRHPLFEDLAPLVNEILTKCASPVAADWRERVLRNGSWNSNAFIDLCEACVGGRDAELTRAAEEIQFAEMHLLLAATFEDAISS